MVDVARAVVGVEVVGLAFDAGDLRPRGVGRFAERRRHRGFADRAHDRCLRTALLHRLQLAHPLRRGCGVLVQHGLGTQRRTDAVALDHLEPRGPQRLARVVAVAEIERRRADREITVGYQRDTEAAGHVALLHHELGDDTRVRVARHGAPRHGRRGRQSATQPRNGGGWGVRRCRATQILEVLARDELVRHRVAQQPGRDHCDHDEQCGRGPPFRGTVAARLARGRRRAAPPVSGRGRRNLYRLEILGIFDHRPALLAAPCRVRLRNRSSLIGEASGKL